MSALPAKAPRDTVEVDRRYASDIRSAALCLQPAYGG